MQDEVAAVQEERGKNYGEFSDHTEIVEEIMASLKKVNVRKNGSKRYPIGFETALFYIVSKLVRLVTTPEHEDSALDLGSYANLWLKMIRKGVKYEKTN